MRRAHPRGRRRALGPRRARPRAAAWTATTSQLAADGREALDALADHAARRDRARRADARARRARGLPPPARRRRPHAGADADRARRASPTACKGLDAGADDYLVKPFALEELLARAAGAAAPHRRRRRASALRFADLELDPAGHTRAPRRAPDRAHPHRVPAARAAHAPPAPGAHPHADLRARLGLRLRAELELARGLRRLPAPQARGGRRAAAASTRCAASATSCASQ